jgi:hypothetical protein
MSLEEVGSCGFREAPQEPENVKDTLDEGIRLAAAHLPATGGLGVDGRNAKRVRGGK